MSCEKDYVILSGRAHPEFTEKMGEYLSRPEFTDHEDNLQARVGNVRLGDFPSSEQFVQIEESVRGKRVFVVQSHGGNLTTDAAIMEQCLMIDAAKRSSAAEVTAVCPYLGYMRQDKKKAGRESISAKFVINALVEAAHADRVITIDMHASQIQGFTDKPFDHLTAAIELEDFVRKEYGEEIEDDRFAIVSPDVGRVPLAQKFQTALGLPIHDVGIVFKGRSKNRKSGDGAIANEVESYGMLGDVSQKVICHVDDLIDTMGTMRNAAYTAREAGASKQIALGTHPVLSGNALERFKESALDRLVITDTLPLRPEWRNRNDVHVVTATRIAAKAIHLVANDGSVSELFDARNYY